MINIAAAAAPAIKDFLRISIGAPGYGLPIRSSDGYKWVVSTADRVTRTFAIQSGSDALHCPL
jgi:hypothetical protein